MLHNVTYVIILDNDKNDGFWGSGLTFETLWAGRCVKKIRRQEAKIWILGLCADGLDDVIYM